MQNVKEQILWSLEPFLFRNSQDVLFFPSIIPETIQKEKKKDHRGFRVSVLLWTTGLAVAARGLTDSCLQGVDSKGNSCYGSPRSPSMVRTRTYSSASPTTDAAITAEITRCKTNVGNNFSKAKQERHKIQRSFITGRTAAGPLLLPP